MALMDSDNNESSVWKLGNCIMEADLTRLIFSLFGLKFPAFGAHFPAFENIWPISNNFFLFLETYLHCLETYVHTISENCLFGTHPKLPQCSLPKLTKPRCIMFAHLGWVPNQLLSMEQARKTEVYEHVSYETPYLLMPIINGLCRWFETACPKPPHRYNGSCKITPLGIFAVPACFMLKHQ